MHPSVVKIIEQWAAVLPTPGPWATRVTLVDARAYFIGESFEQPDGATLQVVAVDPAE